MRADSFTREVMIRWLAQASLEQFLKVVDRVAPKDKWEDRRLFWSAYIEKRVVGNSWVAFGSDGALVARRLAEESADTVMGRFAKIVGAQANHPVLLLQIGDLVIADWSHNGTLRIWRRGNPSSLEFDKSSYIAAELRATPDFATAHQSGWQNKAENYIRKSSGIRLTENEYMPRRRRYA